MTVYQGEEANIEADPLINNPEIGSVYTYCDGVIGTLIDIHWVDKDMFTKELSAVIEKYRI